MAKEISEEDVHGAIAQIMHPAIDRTLVDLGMVKGVSIKENKVTVTLAFPIPNIPIGDYLVNSVRETIESLGADVEVKITVMAKEELNKFLAMEQESWKGPM
ncbi:MAG: iron-sulfur cluster assembly protein [candidate division Zixibacteria bacterium]|nr:iron-sulfur cluster assembly protein [candidate division Zixibacteria bacterium]